MELRRPRIPELGDLVPADSSEADPGSPDGLNEVGREIARGSQSRHAEISVQREAASVPAGRRVERQSLHERGGVGDGPLSET